MVELKKGSPGKQEEGIIEGFSEASRRILVNAWELAFSFNSNIGVGHILTGVRMQMNHIQIISVLSQNRISLFRLIDDLPYVEFDSEMIQAGQEIRLTSRAKDAMLFVAEAAKYRKASQVEPSDLLVGILKYAEVTRRKVHTEIERRERQVEPFLIRKQQSPYILHF